MTLYSKRVLVRCKIGKPREIGAFSGQCETSRRVVVCCSVYSGSGSWLGSGQGGQCSAPRGVQHDPPSVYQSLAHLLAATPQPQSQYPLQTNPVNEFYMMWCLIDVYDMIASIPQMTMACRFSIQMKIKCYKETFRHLCSDLDHWW